MTRTRQAPAPETQLEELWPSIRARIEESKVVSLPPAPAAVPRSPRRRMWWGISAGIAAAVLVAVAAMELRRPTYPQTITYDVGDTSAALVAVVDSAHAYEREAQILLDKLELQRAMLRPDVAEAFDHDLHVVDVAIAELKEAVARDPANPALRQLLATSYRQKVDLLKRVSNAS